MSYNTHFDIEIKELDGAPVSNEEYMEADKGLREMLVELFNIKEWGYQVEDLGPGEYVVDEAPWTACDEDMKKLSAKYPKVYFEVTGDGEWDDDYWITYYYQGNQQEGYISIGIPFEPEKCFNNTMYYLAGAAEMLKSAGFNEEAKKVLALNKPSES